MTKIKKAKKALWIGRFQPFHLGHLHILKDILGNYNFVTVVVGSAQEDYTIKNPLTAKEREMMLKSVMSSLGVSKNQYKIVLTEDIPTNSIWARYISKKAGKFDEVVTSSPLTKLLFEDSGYSVVEHYLYNRKLYSGTEIRRWILKGRSWERLVPSTVFVSLQKIGIERRIREISRSDNPYN